MAKYILSPHAQTSLKEIQAYTLKQFGKQQTLAYLKKIRNQMKDLAITPAMGKERPEIKVGYYCSFVGSHTIYYRLSDTHIDIIDVLHQSMEPMRHLK